MIEPSAHHRWSALLLGLLFATHLGAQQEQKHLVSLSLEELMELRIALPAVLTRLTLAEAPASVTVITADDIRHTPARNIYDLLEVFVPGAIWMNREGGPLPGIRGSTVERNYKYLLLVNGRVVNSKAYFGASSELELWDLSDVQRIEVVRGPGSVTYGPGAVAGVINIVTHDATSNVDDRIAVRGVGRYNSRGLTANHTWRSEGLDLFAYANITRTTGAQARQFLVDDNDVIGFIGEDILTDTEPMEYFADYQGDPQIKLHLDGRFSDLWRVWARYTQQGSTWRGNEVKTDFNGLLVNQEGVRNRQWIANLEHSPRWGDYELTSMVGLSSFDGERRGGEARHPDPDHPLNKRVDFSERELFLSTRLNWRTSDLLEVAVGSEYSWDFYGPGWGDDASIMRHGDGGIIVSGPDSRAIDPTSRGSANRRGTAIYVGDGWSTHTFAAFSEVNVVVSPRVRALLSARADRTTHFDWMVSPRAAVIVGVGEGRFIKFTAQQSRRFNTAAQVLIAVENGFAPDDESLTGLELAYTAYAATGFNVDVVTFWNKGEVIAFDGDANTSKSVGNLELYGVEAAIDYRWENGRVGANYSRVELRDWRLTPGVPRSGISYSDYNQPLKNTDAVQVGAGNDLNNWPNQAFKLFGRLRVADQFTLHADSRVFWDYQGAKDGLVGLQNAVRGQPEEASVAMALAALEPYNVYAFDFRLNASLTYEVGEGLSVQVSARNLLGANGNKRYAHDVGNNRPSPRRIRFVEEPRVFGATLAYAF